MENKFFILFYTSFGKSESLLLDFIYIFVASNDKEKAPAGGNLTEAKTTKIY